MDSSRKCADIHCKDPLSPKSQSERPIFIDKLRAVYYKDLLKFSMFPSRLTARQLYVKKLVTRRPPLMGSGFASAPGYSDFRSGAGASGRSDSDCGPM